MRTRRTIVFTLTMVLLLVFALPALAGPGKAIKETGKDAAVMSATSVLAIGGVYDNACVNAAVNAGYKGKVNMIQPAGNVDIILGISADNLIEGTYWVYLDPDGGNSYNGGGPIGEFTVGALDYGHGSFNYKLPAGTLENGPYTWGIWINGPAGCGTILKTETDLSFTIGDIS